MRIDSRGFALLEVMLASVILVGGIIVVMRGFGSGLDATQTLQNRLIARTQLQNIVDTIQRDGVDIEDKMSGVCEEATSFSWQIKVDEMPDVPQLYRVAVSIHWQEDEHDRQVSTTVLASLAKEENG